MSYETDALDPVKWLKMQKGLRDLGSLGPDVLAMRHVERLLTENEQLSRERDEIQRQLYVVSEQLEQQTRERRQRERERDAALAKAEMFRETAHAAAAQLPRYPVVEGACPHGLLSEAQARAADLEGAIREAGHYDTCDAVLSPDMMCSCPARFLRPVPAV